MTQAIVVTVKGYVQVTPDDYKTVSVSKVFNTKIPLKIYMLLQKRMDLIIHKLMIYILVATSQMINHPTTKG